MPTFKNVSGHPLDLPAFDLAVPVDGTFEVPDEAVASLEHNPALKASRVKDPDQAVDASTVAAVTGSIPVQSPAASVGL